MSKSGEPQYRYEAIINVVHKLTDGSLSHGFNSVLSRRAMHLYSKFAEGPPKINIFHHPVRFFGFNVRLTTDSLGKAFTRCTVDRRQLHLVVSASAPRCRVNILICNLNRA